jgi:hypothetical protein
MVLARDVPERPGIGPPPERLELGDDLHRADLGRARHAPARKHRPRDLFERHPLPPPRDHLCNATPDRPAGEDPRLAENADTPDLRDPPEIVSMEIDRHRELGPLFRIRVERARERVVRRSVASTRARPFDRRRPEPLPPHLESELGARRADALGAEVSEEPIGGGRGPVEREEDVERTARSKLEIERAREVHLVHVTGRDPAEHFADPIGVLAVGLERRERTHVEALRLVVAGAETAEEPVGGRVIVGFDRDLSALVIDGEYRVVAMPDRPCERGRRAVVGSPGPGRALDRAGRVVRDHPHPTGPRRHSAPPVRFRTFAWNPFARRFDGVTGQVARRRVPFPHRPAPVAAEDDEPRRAAQRTRKPLHIGAERDFSDDRDHGQTSLACAPGAGRRGKDRRVRLRSLGYAPFGFTLALALALPLVECKSQTDEGSIQILTVDDPFVGPPAATSILVQAIDYADGGAGGATTTLAQGSASAGNLDLGTYPETNTESILVTATDGAGTQVAWGETLPVELGALAGMTLGVFVQRTGTLSTLPGSLSDARLAPLVSVLGGRYILVAGGSTKTELYDLISWSPLSNPPDLPLVPESIAVAQLKALAISATAATWYDLTDSTASDASAPTANGAWGAIAGGVTITSTDQSTSFVVGATRTSGAPSDQVLVVSSGGTLSWATLTTARLGAAATWVDGYGLVVEGGNAASDASGAGIEVLAAGALNGVAFEYMPDSTTGAAMAPLDSSHVLVVGGTFASGGDAGARVFNLSCKTACAAIGWASSVLTPLRFAQAFAIDGASAFVTGEDANGGMHAYRLAASSVSEVPFRHPRTQARAVRLPFGSPGAGPIALVGGNALIESFVP